MQIQGKEWMKWILITILASSVLGCASAVSNSAICDGMISDRKNHAQALAVDGGDLSIRTGALLIQKLDAACGE